MKIVNMEDAASNFDRIIGPGFFGELGEYTAYPRTPQSEFVSRAEGAGAVLINKTLIGEKELSLLPDLKYIGVLATGYNVVDCSAAKKAGVIVTNVPAYSTSSVAQLVFAHLFNLVRQTELHARSDWSKASDFCYCLTPQIALDGRVMGLFGFGAIGRAVARSAQSFGMRVITATRTPAHVDMPDVEVVGVEDLFRRSDILSLHAPLTPLTEKIVNAETLSLMKPDAFLINTARGGLIDEPALADALLNHRIAGAGLDVLRQEPPDGANPLLHLPNCRVTPHLAWATGEARLRLLNAARENLRSFLAGTPRNVVNG